MTKHVYLVRHGQSNENLDRILRGPSAMLTEEGQRQARILAERVQKIGIEALVSSPLQRAKDTAAEIAKLTGLSVEVADFTYEYERPSVVFGKLEHDPEAQAWRDKIYHGHLAPNSRFHDEENFEELKARCLQTLDFFKAHQKDKICAVTHGFFLRALIGTVLLGDGFTGKEFQRLYHHIRSANTGITVIELNGEVWKLVTWNDSAHLG